MERKDSSATLAEIVRFNADRKRRLVQLKLERMNANAFAFFRGTDHLFARAWTDLRPPDVGPPILISGDLHLENFGAYQTDDGAFLYDINDFDEAVVAPCSLDLVRCTTSILLAGELWSLTPVQAAGIALVFLDRYQSAVRQHSGEALAQGLALGSAQGALWDLLGATAMGVQCQLLQNLTRKTKSGERWILRDPKHPPVGRSRGAKVKAAVEKYGRRRKAANAYRVLDVTERIAGIGSLGLRRYLALVQGGGEPDGYRLLDIKEARPSSLLPCTDQRQPDTGGNEALRVVLAQRQLQARPTRGLDVLEIGKRAFRMRELVPDENRSRLDRLQKQPDKLRFAVAEAGRLTGWSHLRGSHLAREDRARALQHWATGPALDSVLAAAVRFAERTLDEYQAFHKAYESGGFEKKRAATSVEAGPALKSPRRSRPKEDGAPQPPTRPRGS